MGRTISDDIRGVPLVRASRTELGRLLADGGGLIARRCHPELIASMEWLVQRGELMSLLPGIYGDGRVGGEGSTAVERVAYGRARAAP
jgi:hypothetical protein